MLNENDNLKPEHKIIHEKLLIERLRLLRTIMLIISVAIYGSSGFADIVHRDDISDALMFVALGSSFSVLVIHFIYSQEVQELRKVK